MRYLLPAALSLIDCSEKKAKMSSLRICFGLLVLTVALSCVEGFQPLFSVGRPYVRSLLNDKASSTPPARRFTCWDKASSLSSATSDGTDVAVEVVPDGDSLPQQALATCMPPKDKFDLETALFCSGLAFDSYVEPPSNSSRWERGVSPFYTYVGFVREN
jgi:hypothetical protein